MLTDIDIEFVGGGGSSDTVNPTQATALVWIIDGDCLYDIPIWQDYEDMFKNSDEVIDISSEYPDHDGVVVRFVKNGEVVNELKTTEYFGNILLSNPLVLDLNEYPYGRYVQSPHAKFDGEKFIITNRDVSSYLPWHPKNPKAPQNLGM
jgi:hypothetical protein